MPLSDFASSLWDEVPEFVTKHLVGKGLTTVRQLALLPDAAKWVPELVEIERRNEESLVDPDELIDAEVCEFVNQAITDSAAVQAAAKESGQPLEDDPVVAERRMSSEPVEVPLTKQPAKTGLLPAIQYTPTSPQEEELCEKKPARVPAVVPVTRRVVERNVGAPASPTLAVEAHSPTALLDDMLDAPLPGATSSAAASKPPKASRLATKADPEGGSNASQSYADLPSYEEMSPYPRLFVGQKLDKAVTLKPNRWTQIGRSRHARLHIDDTGVSKFQCSIRWDDHRKLLEMRDSSKKGTHVNGENVRGERRTLGHADRVCVIGAGMRYDFVVDLRPCNPLLGDPRKEQRARMKQQSTVPELKRDREKLTSELLDLDTKLSNLQKDAFAKEKDFYEIMTRRRLRIKDNQTSKEDLVRYMKGVEELDTKLDESREQWYEKLQNEYDLNDEGALPVIEEVDTLQKKLDQLQLKRDELLRSIHPTNYAIANVSQAGSVPIDAPTPTGDRSLTQGTPAHDSAGASGAPSRDTSRGASPPRSTAAGALEDAYSDSEKQTADFQSSAGGVNTVSGAKSTVDEAIKHSAKTEGTPSETEAAKSEKAAAGTPNSISHSASHLRDDVSVGGASHSSTALQTDKLMSIPDDVSERSGSKAAADDASLKSSAITRPVTGEYQPTVVSFRDDDSAISVPLDEPQAKRARTNAADSSA